MPHTRRDFLRSSTALAGTVGLLGAGSAAHATGPPPASPAVPAAAHTPPATVTGSIPAQAAGGMEVPANQASMRFIGLEEHFLTPEILHASERLPPAQRDDNMTQLRQSPELMARLEDLGAGRLR